jgi:RNA polymerase sigma factor (sigma-70 family)
MLLTEKNPWFATQEAVNAKCREFQHVAKAIAYERWDRCRHLCPLEDVDSWAMEAMARGIKTFAEGWGSWEAYVRMCIHREVGTQFRELIARRETRRRHNFRMALVTWVDDHGREKGELVAPAAPQESAYDQETRELSAAVMRIADQIADKRVRDIFFAYWTEDVTYEELGAQHGCTRENIRRLLERAYAEIRGFALQDPNFREVMARNTKIKRDVLGRVRRAAANVIKGVA